MSRKTTPARREAFLRVLAETGNQSIAVERAKVSQSWVTLHRASDPEFRARIEGARAEARERLARAREAGGGMAPPVGWGSLDGEELVVRAGNGRRTQIARARLRQWTPRAEARFLAVLAATCNVKAACAEVGLTPASAYTHAKRWRVFANAWAEAVEIGYMRIEAGLLERFGNPFSVLEVDAGEPMPPVSVEQAMQLLHMHKREVRGVGGRPGRVSRLRPFAEVRPGILRKVEWIKRGREAGEALDPEVVADDRREWAARRGGYPTR